MSCSRWTKLNDAADGGAEGEDLQSVVDGRKGRKGRAGKEEAFIRLDFPPPQSSRRTAASRPIGPEFRTEAFQNTPAPAFHLPHCNLHFNNT